jgi:hypothetical protein
MCFVVRKTTSELERVIMTTLYLTDAENTDIGQVRSPVLFNRTNLTPIPDKSIVWFYLAGQIWYFYRIYLAKADKSGSRPDMSPRHF